MTHPLFRTEIFVETAFARRFQAMLRSAWHKRSWHVIVADPGSGKTTSIRDLLKRPAPVPFSRLWLQRTTMMSKHWATSFLPL